MKKVTQMIPCIKCFKTSEMSFDMEAKTSTICPECGNTIDLLYYCPLGMMKGKWLVVLDQEELTDANSKHVGVML